MGSAPEVTVDTPNGLSGAGQQSAPVAQAKRVGSLDFIRGLAVMGILAANIIVFGQPINAYMFPDAFLVPSNDPGNWMWTAQFVLVDGKMRGLFTLLFGAGLYLFMERAWARGQTRWLQVRRLFWLLAFGLFHFFVIWFGDILTYYAMSGLIVLLALRLSARDQLTTGILGYIAGAILYGLMMIPLPFVADTDLGENSAFSDLQQGLIEGKEAALLDDAVEAEIINAGDFTGLIAHRFEAHGTDPLTNFLLFGLETLPLMLIGVALYRMGFFSGEFDRREMRMWGWLGVIGGGLAHLVIALWAKAGGITYYGALAAFVGMSPVPRLAMVVGLAALLVLWAPHATGWLGERVSAAGRAAFTNYLGTSVLMVTLFHGWGFGLFGTLDRPQLYLVTLAVWIIMLAWSKPWLDRFRYGPLEWLWRCLTYGRLFALRR